MDEDGGGGLDIDEFKNAMRQTMGNISDKEIELIFMKVSAGSVFKNRSVLTKFLLKDSLLCVDLAFWTKHWLLGKRKTGRSVFWREQTQIHHCMGRHNLPVSYM